MCGVDVGTRGLGKILKGMVGSGERMVEGTKGCKELLDFRGIMFPHPFPCPHKLKSLAQVSSQPFGTVPCLQAALWLAWVWAWHR